MTFILDENTNPWDLSLGCECYAMGYDGYYYLAVLHEMNEFYAKVTFDANRGLKRTDAPSGNTEWVPLNDICNVSWGIRNLRMEYCGRILKMYEACTFGGQLPDGRLLVYEGGDTGLDKKTTYDCLRLACPPDPFYPYAAQVIAAVTGRKALDKETLRARLIARLDSAFGIAAGGEYELFGRTIRISTMPARKKFLDDLYDKYYPFVEKYLERIAWPATLENIQDNFESNVVSIIGPLRLECLDLMAGAGISMTPAKFNCFYDLKIDHTNINEVVRQYNEVMAKKNAQIRAHNREVNSDFWRSYHGTSADLINPNSVVDKNARASIANDVLSTLDLAIYTDFSKAVNDYVGEKYFDVTASQGETDALWEELNALDGEQMAGPAGLELLLRILTINPFDKTACRYILVNHCYPGCGFTEFMDQRFPGQNLAGQIKWDLLKEWILDQPLHSRAEVVSFMEELDGYFEDMEVPDEDALPACTLVDLISSAYALHDVANSLLLTRYDDGRMPHTDNEGYPDLLRAVTDVMRTLNEEECAAPGRPYNEALLSVCQPLLALIEEDSRTVQGRLFETAEEAGRVLDEVSAVLAAFYHMDFSAPSGVEEIDRLVDGHPHRDLLLPLKKKARRAAELTCLTGEFMAEVSGRTYETRQQLLYDLMRGGILSFERQLLWMQPDRLAEWDEKQMAEALVVFGEEFSNMYDASARYYAVMEKAWIYQNYLNEKNNTQAGFFKKIGTAVSGISKKKYEAEYMLATDNGTRPLAPVGPDEPAAADSCWKYRGEEMDRLYEACCAKYDPAAFEGHKRMSAIKDTLRSILSPNGMGEMKAAVINGDWAVRAPASLAQGGEAGGLKWDEITEEYAALE